MYRNEARFDLIRRIQVLKRVHVLLDKSLGLFLIYLPSAFLFKVARKSKWLGETACFKKSCRRKKCAARTFFIISRQDPIFIPTGTKISNIVAKITF